MERRSGEGEELFSIGTVERLTGLSSRQIRYYEAKGLVRPARTPGHQRVYTRAQVERLRQIKRWLDEGRSLQSIARELAAEAEAEAEGEAVRYAAPERFLRHGLTSLYPVREAGELSRLLERRRQGRARKDEESAADGGPARRRRAGRRKDGQEDA
ncbi:MAG: MerR family transcriptional regulator [Firmicutes bacterium]|nr:MerR family transcriptional regulator [Bacillota bacterium]